MIVSHYNSANGEALAVVHARAESNFDYFEIHAMNALLSLRHLCGRGIAYKIVMGNRSRTGFT